MKIHLEISEDNEITRAPWWIIIDPRQNFKLDDFGLFNIATMLTGPFCSRAEGENHLRRNRHNYSKNARVWCHSAAMYSQYAEACLKSKNNGEEINEQEKD